MSLALLHRRLTAALALSALAAFAAGAGTTPGLLLVGAAIAAAAVRLPPPALAPWVERGARVGILALCAWMLYVAFVLRQDFMPAVMAMLLFLLVAESARSLEARNDGRLYLLSFALLLASTAFYPGLGFAAAFAAFVVLATMALTAGYLRRQAERFSVPRVRLGRRMLVTLAALSAVTLLLSATLFVLFPRLPRQWNVQGRRPGGEVMAGFSDEVRLGQHGGRIGSNPETAFRVEFLDAPPASPASTYWRGRSFDHFDGIRWARTRGAPSLTSPYYAARWGAGVQRMRIFGGPAEARVLFGPHAILSVEPRSAIRVMQEPSDDIVFQGTDAPVYTVVSTAGQPADAVLRSAPGRSERAPARYLQLPPLDPAVRRLADSLTSGMEHRIDRVRAVERFLSTGLEYSLDLPSRAADATVEGFLFRRRAGHCEYFSTAMVMLLRSVGIPARNVTGFAGGEWNAFGDYLAVTGNQAHSWVEVWFGEMGWVAFDPTPASRELHAGAAAGRWSWPFRLWLDGVEYRWYRWVVDYNLERQLTLFSRVGDLFSRGSPGGSATGGGGGRGSPPGWLAAAIAAAAAAALLASGGRRRWSRRSPETRAYLALRRAYARAGVGPAGGPLDFADALDRVGAPGAVPARSVVELYLRARFGGAEPGDGDRRRMGESLAAARAALRRFQRASYPRPGGHAAPLYAVKRHFPSARGPSRPGIGH